MYREKPTSTEAVCTIIQCFIPTGVIDNKYTWEIECDPSSDWSSYAITVAYAAGVVAREPLHNKGVWL